jgi:hypothetical protein
MRQQKLLRSLTLGFQGKTRIWHFGILFYLPSPTPFGIAQTHQKSCLFSTMRAKHNKSANPQPPARAAGDADCLLPQGRVPPPGGDRRIDLSGRHAGPVVSVTGEMR